MSKRKSAVPLFHSTFGRTPYRLSKRGVKEMSNRELQAFANETKNPSALNELRVRINRGQHIHNPNPAAAVRYFQNQAVRGYGGKVVYVPLPKVA